MFDGCTKFECITRTRAVTNGFDIHNQRKMNLRRIIGQDKYVLLFEDLEVLSRIYG
jgi:hypothetical protein